MYTTRCRHAFAGLIVLLLALGHAALGAPLAISAAASMKDAMTDAGAEFQQKTGDTLTFNFLASGPLMKQIEEGAPVDVFISAAHKQMDQLKAEKLIYAASERVIARGELVLIVPTDAKEAPISFTDLADPKFKRLAIGEPKSVPAGDYAMQTLDSLHLTDAIRDRLQTAASVRQVLDYVERGEVDAGIVYRTDALTSKKVRIVAVADETTHKPIEYPAAVVQASKARDEAEKFMAFLSSPEGAAVLKRYGFLSGDRN